MGRGHFEIWGEREELIDTLVKYIGVLEAGDTYVTVTVPGFWKADNLGVNGRFLTVNKDLVRNGVSFHRLFVISDHDLNDPQAMEVLRAHNEAWKSLGKHAQTANPYAEQVSRIGFGSAKSTRLSSRTSVIDHPPALGSRSPGGMFVGVLKLDSKAIADDFYRRINHVAIWRRKETSQTMSITFIARADDEDDKVSSTIVKVRFRELEGGYEYNQMENVFRDPTVQSLDAFLAVLPRP